MNMHSLCPFAAVCKLMHCCDAALPQGNPPPLGPAAEEIQRKTFCHKYFRAFQDSALSLAGLKAAQELVLPCSILAACNKIHFSDKLCAHCLEMLGKASQACSMQGAHAERDIKQAVQ